jgi:hypothetical protein
MLTGATRFPPRLDVHLLLSCDGTASLRTLTSSAVTLSTGSVCHTGFAIFAGCLGAMIQLTVPLGTGHVAAMRSRRCFFPMKHVASGPSNNYFGSKGLLSSALRITLLGVITAKHSIMCAL